MFDINKIPFQKGRVGLVTGENTGLGFETTLALAKKEMKVIMACRNLEKTEAAKARIITKVPNAVLEVRQVYLSKLKSYEHFLQTY